MPEPKTPETQILQGCKIRGYTIARNPGGHASSQNPRGNAAFKPVEVNRLPKPQQKYPTRPENSPVMKTTNHQNRISERKEKQWKKAFILQI